MDSETRAFFTVFFFSSSKPIEKKKQSLLSSSPLAHDASGLDCRSECLRRPEFPCCVAESRQAEAAGHPRKVFIVDDSDGGGI